jgi:hypothetical protein
MIQEYEADKDPMASMNLYHAFRWVARAWPAVTNTTIYRCFRKAKILNQDLIQLPAEPRLDIESLYRQVQISGNIQDAMSIQNFLNPADEDIPPAGISDELQLNDIIAKYTNTGDTMAEDEQDQDIEDEIPILSDQEALKALQILERY